MGDLDIYTDAEKAKYFDSRVSGISWVIEDASTSGMGVKLIFHDPLSIAKDFDEIAKFTARFDEFDPMFPRNTFEILLPQQKRQVKTKKQKAKVEEI